jgi:hypothetical protein
VAELCCILFGFLSSIRYNSGVIIALTGLAASCHLVDDAVSFVSYPFV